MVKILHSGKRGMTKWEWLESYHSFSFGEFFDSKMIHFGPLRVINEDFIAGGGGFPMHPHKDMEIITYVLSGALEHSDSMGSKEVISPNQVQKMTAGSGVFHSEFNNSRDESVHLLQIWILPNRKNLQPYYETKTHLPEQKHNKLLKVAGPDGDFNSVFLNQDAYVYVTKIDTGQEIEYKIPETRGIYLHIIDGAASINGHNLSTGDAVMITDMENLRISATQNSEIILFDVIT